METRNTEQRRFVLEAVRSLQCHATAEEIYQAVVKEHPSVSKGTVYRNLGLLSEKGEIRKLDMTEGPSRYDHIVTEHAHFLCERCGRFFDFPGTFGETQNSPSNNEGFTITDREILLKGICPECQKNKKGEKES